MDFEIKSYVFRKPIIESTSSVPLSAHVMGTNWPIVYLIHGNGEIYVGETSSATGRMEQHLDPNGRYYAKRQKLNEVDIIFDRTFNKSAILDIENSLISLFRYEISQTNDPAKKSKCFKVLQNGNSGQSKLHNYYNRAHYLDEVEEIWKELLRRGIATNEYQAIVNDTIFKFSPYTSLNEEQRETCLEILNGLMDTLEATKEGNPKEYTAIVNGFAGTGKTIVLINLLARIVEAMYSNRTDFDNDNDDAFETSAISLGSLSEEAKIINRIHKYVEKFGKLKIGYVAQMTSLRKTIATVIAELPNVRKKDAMGPFDVVKNSASINCNGDLEIEPFDILLVDEAHRLWQYKKIMPKKKFTDNCKLLYNSNRPDDYTTLDWLFSCSRTRVLVYDESQSVKESDITPSQFQQALDRKGLKPIQFFLKQQMRCRAGMDYLSFLKDLFDNHPHYQMTSFEHYELYYYDDANKLINDIVTKNEQVGLCKVTTGYGWQWDKQKYDDCAKGYKDWLAKNNETDTRQKRLNYYLEHLTVTDGLIDFDGSLYVRNMDFDWILKGDPREIGCIHTAQGYDLNYVGVLFGPEINYSPDEGIIIEEDKIGDTNSIGISFSGLTPEEKARKKEAIRFYIINAYKVMMTRGIKGCYVYAHNKELKAFLSTLLLTR